MMTKQQYYKFLNDNMQSYHDPEFYYPAPTFDSTKKEWIPTKWIKVNNYSESKEMVCDSGLHLMKILCPIFQHYTGNCYLAEGKGLLAEDRQKARFKQIRLLRPIHKTDIFRPHANLSDANLWNAHLRNANLRNADLSDADLRNAFLSNANLRNADLWNADLSNAFLSNADLRNADLSNADLRNADLRNANLRNAFLSNADLSNANLWNADLSNAKNIDESLNVNKAYWNNFTKINDRFKKLLSKERFIK